MSIVNKQNNPASEKPLPKPKTLLAQLHEYSFKDSSGRPRFFRMKPTNISADARSTLRGIIPHSLEVLRKSVKQFGWDEVVPCSVDITRLFSPKLLLLSCQTSFQRAWQWKKFLRTLPSSPFLCMSSVKSILVYHSYSSACIRWQSQKSPGLRDEAPWGDTCINLTCLSCAGGCQCLQELSSVHPSQSCRLGSRVVFFVFCFTYCCENSLNSLIYQLFEFFKKSVQIIIN